MAVEKRHGILRMIGNLYRVLGILSLIGTVFGSIAMCLLFATGGAALAEASTGTGSSEDAGILVMFGIFYAFITFLYGTAFSVGLYGVGEAIFVFLGIEENTRTTSLIMQKRFKNSQ